MDINDANIIYFTMPQKFDWFKSLNIHVTNKQEIRTVDRSELHELNF